MKPKHECYHMFASTTLGLATKTVCLDDGASTGVQLSNDRIRCLANSMLRRDSGSDNTSFRRVLHLDISNSIITILCSRRPVRERMILGMKHKIKPRLRSYILLLMALIANRKQNFI